MNVKPFRAIRPTQDLVEKVASVPYDTIDSAEARELAIGNPFSFLHVVRPEIDLDADTDIHADCVYEKAAENFRHFLEQGTLVSDTEVCLYLYRQKMGDHAQIGVVACCRVEDYENNLILKHEKTRQEKEDDRTRHVLELNANAGPVFLTYKDSDAVDSIVNSVTGGEPLFDLTAVDDVRHTVWRVEDDAALIDAFGAVPVAYIADGHHRSAAAARAGAERRAANPNHTGEEEYNWFLTVLFPATQLNVLPYNRVVKDLNGMSEAEFLAAVRERFIVTEDVPPEPLHSRQVSMYLGGRWIGLVWDETEEDPVSSLDVSHLQNHVLKPLLGIDDPRTSDRIDFIGGIRGVGELVTRVDSNQGAVAFSMFPVGVDQMIAIADAGCIMPPKSTWFEPKLRSGLLVHVLD